MVDLTGVRVHVVQERRVVAMETEVPTTNLIRVGVRTETTGGGGGGGGGAIGRYSASLMFPTHVSYSEPCTVSTEQQISPVMASHCRRRIYTCLSHSSNRERRERERSSGTIRYPSISNA